jgi:hypothetical protein
MRSIRTGLMTLLLAGGAMPLRAGPITIDGMWGDWGINPNSGDFSSSNGTRIFYENYTGKDGTGPIGPGYGGQFFDVEAMYARHEGTSIAFAIVTGFDPDGLDYLNHPYEPGDIFLSLGHGGGADPHWTAGIDLQTGKVYSGVTASSPTDFPGSMPFTITAGDLVGTADLAMTSDGIRSVYHGGDTSSRHYLIEGRLDLGLLDASYLTVGLHWTMSCGNDLGEGFINPPAVPEPGTLALLALGTAALAANRKRLLPKARRG